MDELKGAFNVAIYFALSGGLLGSLFIVFGQNKEIRAITILMIFLSVVMSAALADYLFPPKPWLYAGVGVFTGMISSALLDAFKAVAPKMAEKVIDAVGDAAVAFLDRFGKGKN